jgi:hypothetical protein
VARNSMILVLLFGGTAAVLLSFVLPTILSPENTWSASRADDLQKTDMKIQKLADALGKAASGTEKKRINAELTELQATRADLIGGLDGKVNTPFWLSIVVLVVGIGMTLSGFGVYYLVPMPVEKKKTLAELDPDGSLAEHGDVTALDYRNAVRQSRGKHKSHH